MQSCYRGKTIFVDLIVLDMCDFDVIFETHGMSIRRVSIHCKEKKIIFTMEAETMIFKRRKIWNASICYFYTSSFEKYKKRLSSLFSQCSGF